MIHVEITVRRVPSLLALAFEVVPLVRLGVITGREADMLIDLRYRQRFAELGSTGEQVIASPLADAALVAPQPRSRRDTPPEGVGSSRPV